MQNYSLKNELLLTFFSSFAFIFLDILVPLPPCSQMSSTLTVDGTKSSWCEGCNWIQLQFVNRFLPWIIALRGRKEERNYPLSPLKYAGWGKKNKTEHYRHFLFQVFTSRDKDLQSARPLARRVWGREKRASRRRRRRRSNQISLIVFGSSCTDVVIMHVEAYWKWKRLLCLVGSRLEESARCLEQHADWISVRYVAEALRMRCQGRSEGSCLWTLTPRGIFPPPCEGGPCASMLCA